ncbi:MAG: hypothetical protein HY332_20030, partial [Chloroflexi bacterium]|nr:hypothetical protein [Chloroflexota bacterium]
AYTLSGAQTVGRVRFAIPLAGNVLALAGRREGMIALGGIAVLVLFGRSMARPRSPAA